MLRYIYSFHNAPAARQRRNTVFHSSNTAGFMKVRETGYIHPFFLLLLLFYVLS